MYIGNYSMRIQALCCYSTTMHCICRGGNISYLIQYNTLVRLDRYHSLHFITTLESVSSNHCPMLSAGNHLRNANLIL